MKDVLFGVRSRDSTHQPRSWVCIFLKVHPQCHKLGCFCSGKIKAIARDKKQNLGTDLEAGWRAV